MSLSYIKSGNDWSVVDLDTGNSHSFDESHPDYDILILALSDQDAEMFRRHINIEEAVSNYTGDANVHVKDGQVYYGDEVLEHSMVDRIMDNMRAGVPYENMVAFLNNLMANPSFNSRQELYKFLEHESLPITEDGCFLAYKSVKGNYKDKYSGRFDNTPGQVIEMARGLVDDNSSNHCSKGFHVGALGYAGPGGFYNSSNDNVIICKVNPRDAVSVPTDHSCRKLRVCRYEVVGDYKGALNRPCYKTDAEELDSYDDAVTTSNYVDVEDLEYDDNIRFEYWGSTRYGIVEQVIWDHNTDEDGRVVDEFVEEIKVYMSGNDDDAGETLYFLAEEMYDVERIS